MVGVLQGTGKIGQGRNKSQKVGVRVRERAICEGKEIHYRVTCRDERTQNTLRGSQEGGKSKRIKREKGGEGKGFKISQKRTGHFLKGEKNAFEFIWKRGKKQLFGGSREIVQVEEKK